MQTRQTASEYIRIARKVSTPLIAISTADQFATVATVAKSFEGSRVPPIVQWDCARGFLPVNQEGKAAIKAIMPAEEFPGVTPGLNLVEALTMAAKLPQRSILFLLNAHRFFNEPAVLQGILNVRDPFKGEQRTLILLASIVQLPLELQQDVMTFEEELPGEDVIRAIVVEEVRRAKEVAKDLPEPSDQELRQATEALSGLAVFPAEQATAMGIGASRRLDVPFLWNQKRAFIGQTRGLTFDDSIETFADIGGLDMAKQHGADLFGGKNPPRVIIRIDEIEKHIAGASGPAADSSGTSQDQLGVILRNMEDRKWKGLIAVGPPGGGKSIYTKTLGRTFGAPTLELDLGALKDRFVGSSEENARSVMRIIWAIAGPGAYFVATCNKLDVVPPELRRRFKHGIWFFDLPTREELRPIWAINLKRYELDGYNVEELLDMSDGWTGAEVRNVCELAADTDKPIAAMRNRIVPVSVSDPDSIERLRRLAAGKFLSASYAGEYQHPAERTTATPSTRRFLES
ncbi:MAG: hypothetical protein ABWY78_06425 [Microvirga sp.]